MSITQRENEKPKPIRTWKTLLDVGQSRLDGKTDWTDRQIRDAMLAGGMVEKSWNEFLLADHLESQPVIIQSAARRTTGS